jgi:hypothetical protein
MQRFIGMVLGVLLLASCDTPLKKEFNRIMTDRPGHFRGFSPGDYYEAILQNEPLDQRIFMDSTALQYKIQVSDSEYCQVNYIFESMILTEIHASVFLGKPDDGERLAGLFRNYYEKKSNTPCLESRGAVICTDTTGIHVEIYDETALYESSAVRIWVFKEKRFPESPVPII